MCTVVDGIGGETDFARRVSVSFMTGGRTGVNVNVTLLSGWRSSGEVRGGNSGKSGTTEVLIVSQCHAILRAYSMCFFGGDFAICEKIRRNYG